LNQKLRSVVLSRSALAILQTNGADDSKLERWGWLPMMNQGGTAARTARPRHPS
jgi:hypothetical protein